MSRGVGYLLPDGDAFEEDLCCALVFYPNREEYRRALCGSLDYLGMWLAWERDESKRGADAALSWKLANEETYGCMDMGYCDVLLATLLRIEDKIGSRACCESVTVTYNQNTEVTTVLIPGVGDPPATWGEDTTIVDWDDWLEYVCYYAHQYVDNLIEGAGALDAAVTIGTWGIDFLGFWLSKLIYGSPGGIPVPVNWGWVRAISDALVDGLATLEFDTLAAKFEASRDDIVCAFMQGTSLEDAVEDAVDNSILWTLFYSWLDYDSAVATIYEGEAAGRYLTPNQKDDCAGCGPPAELIPDYSMASPTSDWTSASPYTWDDADTGRFIPGGDYPVDYPNLYSGVFTYPGSAPTVYATLMVRALGRVTHAGTWSIRIRKYPEETIVWTINFVFANPTTEVIEIPWGTPLAFVKGQQYYAQVKISGEDGYGQWISTVSLIPNEA